MTGIAWRDAYQDKAERDIYSEWQGGARNVLYVLPTGGGKSVVVSRIAKNNAAQRRKQVIMAHRNELVGQLSGHMAARGITHRVLASDQSVREITQENRKEYGKPYINPDADTTVSSVDTLLARASNLTAWAQQISQWTVDEAHHLLRDNKWGRAAALFPNAYGLGVTASPGRADGKGLGRHSDGLFDSMILGPTMRQLIDNGALCDYEIVVPESDFYVNDNDFNADGELSPKKGREASKRSHIVGDVVKNYCRYSLFKRAICFATDVETAGEIAADFNAHGITAVAISAKTPGHLRAEYIRRFKAGKIWVLVNVDLFGEGFDVPAVETVIMARPTGSLAVYLQQFGRALRLLAGKFRGLIIDHVSNWKRHGFPDKHHWWTLDRREKRAKLKDPDLIDDLINCKSCSRPYLSVFVACPHCGAEPPLPDPVSRSIEMVAGDLYLMDATACAAMRAACVLETPASVAERVGYVAGSHAGKFSAGKQIERIETQQRLNTAIATWAAHGRLKGYSDRELDKRFYAALNCTKYDALAAPRADMERLLETIEEWNR